jgi:hypothetical protein
MVPPIFESSNAPGGEQKIAHDERGQKFDVEPAEQVRCV